MNRQHSKFNHNSSSSEGVIKQIRVRGRPNLWRNFQLLTFKIINFTKVVNEVNDLFAERFECVKLNPFPLEDVLWNYPADTFRRFPNASPAKPSHFSFNFINQNRWAHDVIFHHHKHFSPLRFSFSLKAASTEICPITREIIFAMTTTTLCFYESPIIINHNCVSLECLV